MNTTVKALIVGTVIAAATVTALHAATPAPVVKLEPVVVTAKRLPVQHEVIKLNTVLVTATKERVLAAQEEASKQAATAFAPQS